jgi:hypothetical protein
MPHVDGALLRGVWTAQGQSRLAQPVAAVTAVVRRALAAVTGVVTAGGAHRPQPPRVTQDLEVRRLEDRFARAVDAHDLERMERDWDRRDGGGMRTWDWR